MRQSRLAAVVELVERRLMLAYFPDPVFAPDAVPLAPPDVFQPPPESPERFDISQQPSIPSGKPVLSRSTWTSVGPAPIKQGQTPGESAVTGRITSIAVDPTDHGGKTYYVGSANGGVWKTTDGGSSWAPLTDDQATLSIGSVAVAPSNRNVIYAGTGEANNSQDSNYGRGVLRSLDGGNTWTLMGQSVFDRLSIGRIAVHPTNPQIVFVAVSIPGRHGVGAGTGVYRTLDGGQTWVNTTSGITTVDNWSDLAMNPANPNILYAAVGNRSAGSANGGVWKTVDGGANWAPAGDYPNGTSNGRIALAISPSMPSTLYAAAVNPSTNALLRMSRSTDGGATWTDVTSNTPNFVGSQGWYDIALAVDPSNPNIVIAGGAEGTNSIIRSTNGGASWSSIAVGADGEGPHVGHHAATFDANGRLLVGTDGGIWRGSNSGPLKWANLNGNLQITQFVGVAIHPTDNNNILGGSKDHGTSATHGASQWTLREGGDGGLVSFSTTNPNTVYHIAPVASFGSSSWFRRSDDGGVSWNSKTTGLINGSGANFYAPFAVDPSNGAHLVLGTNVVNATTSGGDGWTAISPQLTGSAIDALAISKTNAGTIYAASAGRVFVTTNHGANWTERPVPIVDHIQDLVVDPVNRDIVYAVRDQFGGPKVFRSTNAGLNWTDASGNLPDVPVFKLVLDPRNGTLYVGTDNGVYASANLGTTWSRHAGLPNVQVRDLELNQNSVLAVGTYGRGVYAIRLDSAVSSEIRGTVFNDLNDNGQRDSGEGGLSGWTIYQDQDSNGIHETATTTRTSPSTPLSIADSPGAPVAASVNIAGTTGVVQRVTMTMSIAHTFDGDLVATLISPSGTRVPIIVNVGGAGKGFTNTTFDDAATTFIADGTAPFTGTFAPVGLLSKFQDESANGIWSLEIKDIGPGDTGALTAFTLNVSTGEPMEFSDRNGDYVFNNPVPGSYRIGQVPQFGWRQTTPDSAGPGGGFYDVTVVTGQDVTGRDFGNVADSIAPTITSSPYLFDAPVPALAINFSENVGMSLSLADLTITTLPAGPVINSANLALSYNAAAARGIITFPGLPGNVLPDGNYRLAVSAGSVSDLAGNALGASYSSDFFVFAGDANRDRTIDIGDFSVLTARFNLSGTFSQGDFNYDGIADIGDFAILASKFNTSLPAAPAAAAPSEQATLRPAVPSMPIDRRFRSRMQLVDELR